MYNDKTEKFPSKHEIIKLFRLINYHLLLPNPPATYSNNWFVNNSMRRVDSIAVIKASLEFFRRRGRIKLSREMNF